MNFFTKQKWTHRHRKRTYGYQRENVVPSLFSPVRLLVILWTAARQAPLSMRFFRQEYWNGLPCPSPGNLPNPRIKPVSLKSPAPAGEFFCWTRDKLEIQN